VLYTDGVTEVRRRRREVFGHHDLSDVLQGCVGLAPDAIAERVEKAVLSAAAGRPRDDIAILALGPHPTEADAPAILPGAVTANGQARRPKEEDG
jgi:Stage II sporulation protein E (SpoIIE)